MVKFQAIVTNTSYDKRVSLVSHSDSLATLACKDAVRIVDFLASTKPCILFAGIDLQVADHVVSLLK
jgi:hypothetical protein